MLTNANDHKPCYPVEHLAIDSKWRQLLAIDKQTKKLLACKIDTLYGRHQRVASCN